MSVVSPLPPLLSLTPAELSERLESPVRARRLWRHLREGRKPSAEALQGERIFKLLQERVSLVELPVVSRSASSCQTRKLLLELHDGHQIETVIIPGVSRSTLCVSSQVGCVRGCTFCMTATMGILRNLTVEEIVGQVYAAAREIRESGLPPLRNIVYMGMGEPLDNSAAMRKSVEILLDRDAFQLSARHVTVSTVGTTPHKIRSLRELRARLAWSVHAVDDGLRKRLVPTTKHPMTELREAFVEVMAEKKDALMVELTLMQGVNDREEDARRLAEFLKPFVHGVRVNLIPMNPGREGLSPSQESRMERFAEIVQEGGHYCCLRRERGQDSKAACGQLAVEHANAGRKHATRQ